MSLKFQTAYFVMVRGGEACAEFLRDAS